MDNWRKFGNPDGKQPMEVSIALPTFLLEKEHHNTILIIYLIAMVVVIPCESCRLYTHPGYDNTVHINSTDAGNDALQRSYVVAPRDMITHLVTRCADQLRTRGAIISRWSPGDDELFCGVVLSSCVYLSWSTAVSRVSCDGGLIFRRNVPYGNGLKLEFFWSLW